jgi:mono/diheme cytochrome c family protein
VKVKLAIFTLIMVTLSSFLAKGDRTNPPVERTVAWDSPETEALFQRACMDCHSNGTVWPWYSNFAPISWSIIHHVNEGREHFNISMNDMGRHAHEAGEEVLEEEMPITSYLSQHPEARLSTEERETLALGMERTFGAEWGDDHHNDHGDHDHEDHDDQDH